MTGMGKTMRKVLTRKVQFEFLASEAQDVYSAGDFNNWHSSANTMKKDQKGTKSKREVRMKRRVIVAAFAIAGVFAFAPVSNAQHGHGGGEMQHGSTQPGTMLMESTEVFTQELEASFMVMRNENHRNMLKNMKLKDDIEPGTTNNIMVKLKEYPSGKEITEEHVTIRVVAPDGKEQLKTANYKEMMKTWDAYFVLLENGKYEISVIVKKGGQKRTVGFIHDLK